MGYYTEFVIEWDTNSEDIAKRFEKIFKDWGMVSGDYYLDESCLSIYTKWYDMEKDLYAISKEFPEVMFTVNGNGEQAEDYWCQWWQDGKMEEHMAKIEPFNPDEMKEFNVEMWDWSKIIQDCKDGAPHI